MNCLMRLHLFSLSHTFTHLWVCLRERFLPKKKLGGNALELALLENLLYFCGSGKNRMQRYAKLDQQITQMMDGVGDMVIMIDSLFLFS